MTSLVEIRDLKVEAKTDSGRRIEIIRGVSLEIAPGEIVALIGESGSGKTTIALTLMGYAREGCRISGGSVVVDGQDMVILPERERAAIRGTKVSYVPQSAAAAFNPAHRIIDQVIEITRIHKLMSEAEARARAIELFRAMSLPEPETIGERYPHQVSGGQLQRLAAVMALIGDPSVVIFDEPTTALDVTTQIEVLRAFEREPSRAHPFEMFDFGLRRRFSFVWHRGKYHGAALRRFVEDCRAFTAGARRSDEIPVGVSTRESVARGVPGSSERAGHASHL